MSILIWLVLFCLAWTYLPRETSQEDFTWDDVNNATQKVTQTLASLPIYKKPLVTPITIPIAPASPQTLAESTPMEVRLDTIDTSVPSTVSKSATDVFLYIMALLHFNGASHTEVFKTAAIHFNDPQIDTVDYQTHFWTMYNNMQKQVTGETKA